MFSQPSNSSWGVWIRSSQAGGHKVYGCSHLCGAGSGRYRLGSDRWMALLCHRGCDCARFYLVANTDVFYGKRTKFTPSLYRHKSGVASHKAFSFI